ncbi:hypothetical protein AYO40_00325 [Planctomycetaceae bacterium SCGC AG-212-D15]|nr:hypothetical protein AYO40_00325 [Planctomycetaceae bacterium SCGC AG-212-D15]
MILTASRLRDIPRPFRQWVMQHLANRPALRRATGIREPSMPRNVAAILVAVWIGASAGCVERRMVIASDPPGALVLHNGVPLGNSPADDHFIYYGIHHFTVIRPGYATLQVDQRIPPPWYQYFPLDLISETLLPYQIEDVRRFTYQMQPLPGTRSEEIADRAAVLRDKGKSIVPPPPQSVRRGLLRRPSESAPPTGSPPAPPPPPGTIPPPAVAPVPPARPPVPPATAPGFIGGAPGSALSPQQLGNPG